MSFPPDAVPAIPDLFARAVRARGLLGDVLLDTPGGDDPGTGKRFNPAEPRDEGGRWTAGGGHAAAPAVRPRSEPLATARGLVNTAIRRRVIKAVKNEGELAEAIGGFNLPDSEPADVMHVNAVDARGNPTGEPIRFEDAAHARAWRARRALMVKAMRDPRRSAAERERIGHVLETVQPLHFFEVKTLLTSKAGTVRMSAAARARKERWAAKYHAHFHLVAIDDRRGSKHSGHRVHFLEDQLHGTTHLHQMDKATDMAAVLDHAHGRAGG